MTSLVLFPTIYRQLSRPLYDYEGQKVALFTCHYLCDHKSNWLETSEYVYLIPNQHITSKLDWKKNVEILVYLTFKVRGIIFFGLSSRYKKGFHYRQLEKHFSFPRSKSFLKLYETREPLWKIRDKERKKQRNKGRRTEKKKQTNKQRTKAKQGPRKKKGKRERIGKLWLMKDGPLQSGDHI